MVVSVIKDPMLLSDVDAIDEGTIVQAAIAGKPEAFAELFHRYYPMIYAFAFRLCLDAKVPFDYGNRLVGVNPEVERLRSLLRSYVPVSAGQEGPAALAKAADPLDLAEFEGFILVRIERG